MKMKGSRSKLLTAAASDQGSLTIVSGGLN